jgi:di/tricarboxylate transporter
MSFAAIFTLFILVIAAVLLVSEKLRPDLIALGVMVILGLTGIVTQAEAFSGFGGSAVMTLVGISIISEGLRQTGVTLALGNLMSRLGGKSESLLILAALVVSALLSMFMNNIAVVGVLLPAVMAASRRSRVPESRLLMPLAYGTLLGGMATLLTTANIIVSGALRDAGFRSFGLLDFLPVGGPVAVVGILYMMTLGRRLMPKPEARKSGPPQQARLMLADQYQIEQNLHELEVLRGSPLADKSIAEGAWGSRLQLAIIALTRNFRPILAPEPEEVIRTGDHILVQGSIQTDSISANGLSLCDFRVRADDISNETITLAELVITPRSEFIGHSLLEMNFREKFGLNVLGIWREGKPLLADFASLPLHFGDALLVQGLAARIHGLHRVTEFILLQEDPDAVLKPRKQRLAFAITFLTLGIASLGFLSVSELVLAGAVLLLLTGCLDMGEAYHSIEWKAIFLIAGMWPLSIAIRSTGLAQAAVGALQGVWGQISPLAVAAILILITLLLTQFMSGQVASLVLAPVAIVAATTLNIDPRGFAMAVALACSLAFPTPFGHPVNVMVMNPGNYRFRDYLRVGLPLTVLSMGVILLGLSWWAKLN